MCQNVRYCIYLQQKYMTMLETGDERFMDMALKEAETACAEGEVPVGAVMVCRNTVIARAHNMTERLNDPTAHAEMQLITMASDHLGGKYLRDCTLYVTVEPCPMCAAALSWAQIGRVVYGCVDEKRGASLYKPSLYHPKTMVSGGIRAEEAAELMRRFFKKRRQ